MSLSVRINGKTIYDYLVNAARSGIPAQTQGVWKIFNSGAMLAVVQGTFEEAAEKVTKLRQRSHDEIYIDNDDLNTDADDKAKARIEAASLRVKAAASEAQAADYELLGAMRHCDARLSCMAKLEPIIKELTNDEVHVAEEILGGLLKQLTA